MLEEEPAPPDGPRICGGFAFALLNLITQKEILTSYKSELNKFYIFQDVLKLF